MAIKLKIYTACDDNGSRYTPIACGTLPECRAAIRRRHHQLTRDLPVSWTFDSKSRPIYAQGFSYIIVAAELRDTMHDRGEDGDITQAWIETLAARVESWAGTKAGVGLNHTFTPKEPATT